MAQQSGVHVRWNRTTADQTTMTGNGMLFQYSSLPLWEIHCLIVPWWFFSFFGIFHGPCSPDFCHWEKQLKFLTHWKLWSRSLLYLCCLQKYTLTDTLIFQMEQEHWKKLIRFEIRLCIDVQKANIAVIWTHVTSVIEEIVKQSSYHIMWHQWLKEELTSLV